MKLELTDKYFPKSYRYLLDSEHAKNTDQLINKYSLKGLVLPNPKTDKSEVMLSNQVSNSTPENLILNTMKEFNARLHLDSNHSVVIIYSVKSSNSTLVDHAIYDKLITFVQSYHHIKDDLLDYVNTDKLLLSDLKSGYVKTFFLQDDHCIGIDIYSASNSFYYTNSDLLEFELAFRNKDMKVIRQITVDVKKRVRADSKRFTKQIKPMLPTLMVDDSSYYRHQMKHGWLLYLVGERLHV